MLTPRFVDGVCPPPSSSPPHNADNPFYITTERTSKYSATRHAQLPTERRKPGRRAAVTRTPYASGQQLLYAGEDWLFAALCGVNLMLFKSGNIGIGRYSKPSIRVRFPAGPPLMLRSHLRLSGCWISAITEPPWPSPDLAITWHRCRRPRGLSGTTRARRALRQAAREQL